MTGRPRIHDTAVARELSRLAGTWPEVAKLVGVSVTTIHRWVSGRQTPNAQQLRRLKRLGVDVAQMID